MTRRGLDVVEELVRECEWTIASGFEQCVEILKLERRATALVTASGELGLGAPTAARKARIDIPGELALACFDALYFSPLLQPSLTAIRYDARAIGRGGAPPLLARGASAAPPPRP